MQKDSDYLKLLFSISELADLVTGSSDLEGFLQRSVDLVALHFSAPVCSIYLYDDTSDRLTLKATKGLKPESVNKIHLKPGEGLVGQSFDMLAIVREGNASQHPAFKYFPETGEDRFNSFLCVPIRRGVERIGVLAVQHQDFNHFTQTDERAIRSVVTQLDGSIENARLLIALLQAREETPAEASLQFVKGRAATSGYAMGKAVIFLQKKKSVLYDPLPGEDRYDRQDFKKAVERTTRELKELQKEFERRLPESASLIFTAHFMILKDKNFVGRMEEQIAAGTLPCDAVRKIAAKYIAVFSSSPHAYMREKAQDVEDLSIRILTNFSRSDDSDLVDRGTIAIIRQVYPSDILKLVSAGIKGIIMTSGGATSHVTILARSLHLPIIIAEDTKLLALPDQTTILMDGELGNIYVNPDPETIALFESRLKVEKESAEDSMSDRTLSRDGEEVTLRANINLLSEVTLARKLKAEGVGLYRTEFPFLIRATFPSEAEQYIIYKRLFDEMDGQPVVIRTLDAGGEKTLAYSDAAPEANPDLGLRSIRFSLRHRDLFEFQIRAMLRAAEGRDNIRIMFPLISSIDEFLTAKQVVEECCDTLSRENLAFNPDVPLGMMVELPSVIETIDEFAREADFFSIGTNDFIQYMLAADRANKMVADHYIPHHPAVNRGLQKIVNAAQDAGIEVSVCGEMAHEKEYIPFLLGLGVRVLSVDPQFLADVQKVIQNLNIAEARTLARDMVSQTSIQGVETVMAQWRSRHPES